MEALDPIVAPPGHPSPDLAVKRQADSWLGMGRSPAQGPIQRALEPAPPASGKGRP
jgi:hypothetical protein